MIELISFEFLFIAILAFVAGLLKTTFGIGAGVFLTPIASLIVEPKIAVALLAPLMLASDITTLRYNWKKWDVKQLFIIVPSGLFGIFFGTIYLSWAPSVIIQISIGLIAVFFSIFQLYRFLFVKSNNYKKHNSIFGIGISFIAGVASSIAHSGGIVLTIYLVSLNLPKYVFISTLTSYLFFNDILKNILFFKFNILSYSLFVISLCAVPALYIGSYFGYKIVGTLSHIQFFIIINMLILSSGIILVFRSIF